MKITLTPIDLRPQEKAKSPKRLPGESHPFVPRSSNRNLVPPQQLIGCAIDSGRKHEVGYTDPLMQRIKELEAENKQLHADRSRLLVLATKHCPRDHHDFATILELAQ